MVAEKFVLNIYPASYYVALGKWLKQCIFSLISEVRSIYSMFPQVHSRFNISCFCDSPMNCDQEWGYLMVKN